MSNVRNKNIKTPEEYGNSALYPNVVQIKPKENVQQPDGDSLELVEKEIQIVIELKNRIYTLNQKLQADKNLYHQYQLHLENRLTFPNSKPSPDKYCATKEFLDLFKKYEIAAEDYVSFKDRVLKQKLIAQNEIDEIEQTFQTNKHSQANYFPLFQHQYDLAAKSILEEKESRLQNKTAQLDSLTLNYSERSRRYKTFEAAMAPASVLALPLPILIGGLLCHAIDKIVTTIRKNIIQLQLSNIKKDAQNKINAVTKEINKQIMDGSKNTVLRQGFFRLRKVQHEENIVEKMASLTPSSPKP